MPQTRRPRGTRIADDVHRALRIRAAETGETMEDIVDRALRKELGMMTIYEAWLGDALMGEGQTEQEAIDAAVAEYERSIGYGDEPHLYADRAALVAALDVSAKED